MDINERFATNLARERHAAGLSQEDLAFRANVHRTQISLIEGGKRLPRLDTLVKLSGALGVAPGQLLDGISWQPLVSTPGGFKVSDPKK